MKRQLYFILFFILISAWLNRHFAQCCSAESIVSMMLQSGVSAGYGIQYYDADGFNKYINLYNQKYGTNMDDFGLAKGFRFGLNVIQIHVEDIMIGLKLNYYQMNEKKSATRLSNIGGQIKEEFDLSLSSLGVGFSSSLMVSKRLDIKFLEALLTWNNAKLVTMYSGPDLTLEQKLESPRSKIGLSVGSGLAFYIFPPFLSVEAIGGYSFLSITQMQYESGYLLPQAPEENSPAMKNFVNSGGWFAFLQLNLAVNVK